MTYTVFFNREIQVVELRFHDSASIEDHHNSRKEILQICKDNKINKALVHLGNLVAQKTLSRAEQFEFSKSWSEDIAGKIYFGVVMPENIESQDEFYFIISTSKMEGIIMQPFYKEHLAIEWLTNTD